MDWKNKLKLDESDFIEADLRQLSIEQYAFNRWMDDMQKCGDEFFVMLNEAHQVKLSWWKCWFWWLLPSWLLGVNDKMRFHSWDIGHCLNCDANPYDGTIVAWLAWSYDCKLFRGALIRCGKCRQLRWQEGKWERYA